MNQLDDLLQRLKAAQHALLDQAARIEMIPSDGALRKIANLENTIAAIYALKEERGERTTGEQLSEGKV